MVVSIFIIKIETTKPNAENTTNMESEFAAALDLPVEFKVSIVSRYGRRYLNISRNYVIAIEYEFDSARFINEPLAPEITKINISTRQLTTMKSKINEKLFGSPMRSIYNPNHDAKYSFEGHEYLIIKRKRYYGNMRVKNAPFGFMDWYDSEITRTRETVRQAIWILPVPIYSAILDYLPMTSVRP